MFAPTIRRALPSDESAWRELWQGYCDFYGSTVSEEVTAHTWARILDASSSVHCVVAEQAGRVIGMANYVVHENTFELQPVCYLEDLFVSPSARGTGAGKALLQWLKDGLKREGWARLYWMTRNDNHAARKLYDQFVAADDFVRYVVRR
jgi:GNAT superfamily N-acetyltransferase